MGLACRQSQQPLVYDVLGAYTMHYRSLTSRAMPLHPLFKKASKTPTLRLKPLFKQSFLLQYSMVEFGGAVHFGGVRSACLATYVPASADQRHVSKK